MLFTSCRLHWIKPFTAWFLFRFLIAFSAPFSWLNIISTHVLRDNFKAEELGYENAQEIPRDQSLYSRTNTASPWALFLISDRTEQWRKYKTTKTSLGLKFQCNTQNLKRKAPSLIHYNWLVDKTTRKRLFYIEC